MCSGSVVNITWPSTVAASSRGQLSPDQPKAVLGEPDIVVANDVIEAKHTRLTRAEEAKLLRLRLHEGLSFEAIAAATKRSIATVHAYLSPLESTVEQARAKLNAAADGAVDDFVLASKVAATQGNHKAAKDLLVAAGAISSQPDTAIAIQVNVPRGGESGQNRGHNPLPNELIELSDTD